MVMLSDAEADTPLAVALQEVYTWLTEGIGLVRHLTIDLTPPVLKQEGLAEALQWLVSHMAARYDLHVDLQVVQPCLLRDEICECCSFRWCASCCSMSLNMARQNMPA